MKTYGTSNQTQKTGATTAVARNAQLENLMRTTGPRAYTRAYELTGNPDDADNLVQESFYRVARSWESFDGGQSSLESWLFTIMRNAFCDMVKRLDRRVNLSLDYVPQQSSGPRNDEGGHGQRGESLAEILPAKPDDVLERLENEESQRTIEHELKGLRSELRDCATLCLRDGWSYNEISEKLGVSAGTVRSRISRARKVLRLRLAEYKPGAPSPLDM